MTESKDKDVDMEEEERDKKHKKESSKKKKHKKVSTCEIEIISFLVRWCHVVDGMCESCHVTSCDACVTVCMRLCVHA